MQGDYHSVFKGSGLEFDDVRPYQYGDDVRHIDWNVSAKGHGPFIKTFKEEKEQQLFFLVDVSASQNIGRQGSLKLDVSKEICGVLALSAVKEDSSIGLLCFSDRRERYIKPGKGGRHAYHIIDTVFNIAPQSTKTNLSEAMKLALATVKRKSIFVVISDFLDEGYERHLRALAAKHDLIVIQVVDQRETHFPKLGILPIYDQEAQKTIWVNTSSKGFRNRIDRYYKKGREELAALCHRYHANYLLVDTSEDYLSALVRLFKVRNRHGR